MKFLCGALLLVVGISSASAQQAADPNFSTTVERPAYTGEKRPRVVIDEAHDNFHTAEGRYKPLADLLRGDGYEIMRGTKSFTAENLAGTDVLVISNALHPHAEQEQFRSAPAFTEAEADVVRDWVRTGGALLLIADHAPFGAAAKNLAARFGVGLGGGYVFDRQHSNADQPSLLVFSRDNGLLADHPITRGRDASERITRVVTFTGESLSVPAGASALLRLSPSAYECAGGIACERAMAAAKEGQPLAELATAVAGRAQGLALPFGKGRVVVMGEAAMFSAQVVRFEEGGKPQEFKMGMNVPGNDDRQLLLNVMHWLSGVLD